MGSDFFALLLKAKADMNELLARLVETSYKAKLNGDHFNLIQAELCLTYQAIEQLKKNIGNTSKIITDPIDNANSNEILSSCNSIPSRSILQLDAAPDENNITLKEENESTMEHENEKIMMNSNDINAALAKINELNKEQLKGLKGKMAQTTQIKKNNILPMENRQYHTFKLCDIPVYEKYIFGVDPDFFHKQLFAIFDIQLPITFGLVSKLNKPSRRRIFLFFFLYIYFIHCCYG